MARTLRVGDNLGDVALHEGNGGVGGTQIDTDHRALDLGVVRLIAGKPRGDGLPGEGGRAAGDGRSPGKLQLKADVSSWTDRDGDAMRCNLQPERDATRAS